MNEKTGLSVGILGHAETVVTREMTAASVGSGLLEVYSTPSMVGLMEKAAQESVLPYISDGQGSVGIRLEINHLAAVPVGEKVWVETELIEIDGRFLTFKVEAFSEKEKIGDGIHRRCIINSKKFIDNMGVKYN